MVPRGTGWERFPPNQPTNRNTCPAAERIMPRISAAAGALSPVPCFAQKKNPHKSRAHETAPGYTKKLGGRFPYKRRTLKRVMVALPYW